MEEKKNLLKENDQRENTENGLTPKLTLFMLLKCYLFLTCLVYSKIKASLESLKALR